MEETHHDRHDQDQYLMWMKRKQILKSHIQVAPFGISSNNSSSSSWEERAFAEDAARILGGCIWPPRSYSCSFCKREFRSAQALGGHMNVHRRDRARLKRSLSPHNHHHDHESSSSSLHHHHGKNDCKSSLLLGTSHHHQSSGENYCHYYSSSLIGATDNNYKAISSSKPSSSDSEPKEGKVNAITRSYCNDGGYVETSLCVGLNNNSSSSLCGDEESYCKRPKRTNSSMFSSFLKPCSNDRRLQVALLQSAESFAVPTGTGMEDLDLELRLGKPQKV